MSCANIARSGIRSRQPSPKAWSSSLPSRSAWIRWRTGGAKISAQDGVTVRLDAQGAIICHTGVTEQGQGAEAVIAQIAATAFGVPLERVRVITGDTDNTPYGGGTWASRAAGIGGEAALRAGNALRANVLACAALILQAKPEHLDIQGCAIAGADRSTETLPVHDVLRIG